MPAPSARPSSTSRSASVERRRGVQPSSVRARSVDMTGMFAAMSSHPGSEFLRGGASTLDPHEGAQRGEAHGNHPARTDHLGERYRVEHRLSGYIERAACTALDDAHDGVGEVVGVHGLRDHLHGHRQHRNPHPADPTHRQEAAHEQPRHLARRVALEHESRPHARDQHLGVRGLEGVEDALAHRLLAAVVRGVHAARRPVPRCAPRGRSPRRRARPTCRGRASTGARMPRAGRHPRAARLRRHPSRRRATRR